MRTIRLRLLDRVPVTHDVPRLTFSTTLLESAGWGLTRFCNPERSRVGLLRYLRVALLCVRGPHECRRRGRSRSSLQDCDRALQGVFSESRFHLRRVSKRPDHPVEGESGYRPSEAKKRSQHRRLDPCKIPEVTGMT